MNVCSFEPLNSANTQIHAVKPFSHTVHGNDTNKHTYYQPTKIQRNTHTRAHAKGQAQLEKMSQSRYITSELAH